MEKLAKKVEEKKEAKVAPSSTKGMVIREKRTREEAPDSSPIKKGAVDDLKGKEKEMPLLDAKKAKSNKTVSGTTRLPALEEGTLARPSHPLGLGPSMMASASVAKKILAGVVLFADRENVERFGLDQVVTKFLHCIGQVSTYFHS